MNRTKLQKVLNRLDGKNQGTLDAIRNFDENVKILRDKLQQDFSVPTLQEVNQKISSIKKAINVQPLLTEVAKLQTYFKDSVTTILNEIENKTAELEAFKSDSNQADQDNSKQTNKLGTELTALQAQLKSFIESNTKTINSVDNTFNALVKNIQEESGAEIKKIQDALDKVKRDVMFAQQHGGGSMNRKITYGGTDYLKKYTDINYKAGANVTFSIVDNNTTKMVDVTIAGTGGGSGIVRSINSISSSTGAGSAASTDYVYLCTGTLTLTLPTAVANTGLYTVKNVGSGTVTIATTSSQTIDGASTIVMPVQYTAVDLISDTANWNVT